MIPPDVGEQLLVRRQRGPGLAGQRRLLVPVGKQASGGVVDEGVVQRMCEGVRPEDTRYDMGAVTVAKEERGESFQAYLTGRALSASIEDGGSARWARDARVIYRVRKGAGGTRHAREPVGRRRGAGRALSGHRRGHRQCRGCQKDQGRRREAEAGGRRERHVVYLCRMGWDGQPRGWE
ncbi:uncharacterized protein PG986_002274 [Apiospora aurea]|uniref:Uncharacterized protein n=1 Tax=Apiospora aurea TaxID=335848 RepID=A0ABR1QZV8_9PEZI